MGSGAAVYGVFYYNRARWPNDYDLLCFYDDIDGTWRPHGCSALSTQMKRELCATMKASTLAAAATAPFSPRIDWAKSFAFRCIAASEHTLCIPAASDSARKETILGRLSPTPSSATRSANHGWLACTAAEVHFRETEREDVQLAAIQQLCLG